MSLPTIIVRMHRHASSFTLLTMTLMAVTQQAYQEVEQILNFYHSVLLYAYTFRGAPDFVVSKSPVI